MGVLDIAATGMQANQFNVEVISNNLANLNTAAFKRERAEFQDLLYQNIKKAGSPSSDAGTILPSGMQLGLGVSVGSVYRINEQGPLNQNDNEFSYAIAGKGYFAVQLPSGDVAYTRAGNFTKNEQGQIVTQQGYIVNPGITIPANALGITVNTSGEVTSSFTDTTQVQNLGQFELVNFINEGGLEAMGGNLFGETIASGAPIIGVPAQDGFGLIQQGFIEASNVDPVKEVTTLISAQRAYELNSKALQAGDEMMQSLNNVQ